MESRDVFSQQELDEALSRPDLIPVCAGDGQFELGGDHFVRAADSARMVVGDDASVEAGGSTSIVASGRAHVATRDSATVEAGDSTHVIAGGHVYVRAYGRARVVASADATVDAGEDAYVVALGRARVRAGDRCRVRAVLTTRAMLRGECRAWVWGQAVVHAQDRVAVTAWGNATVHAAGAARVEALETAIVTATGSASVRACGAVMVRARGAAQIDAAAGVAVMRHGGRAVSGGGAVEVAHPATAAEWCAWYGVPVEDGVAVLFKAVDDNFDSYYGMSYRPGSVPVADDWDGGVQECGGGLHFSPRPTFAVPGPADEMRFVACPVRVADIAFHPGGMYPDKVKAKGACAPVWEVHEDGTAVDARAAAAGRP
ncbi:MAG TPA: hypothetical protein VFB51_13690 [Solirubrobacterales bacterium]|nr:hypothetical protein [Solirubrobacterales bacterium]